MQAHEDQQIWELLKDTRQMQVPANFTNNVLRRIRLEDFDRLELSFTGWWRQSWRLMSGLTTGAALLVTMFFIQETHLIGDSLAFSDKPELSKLIASVPLNELNEFGEMDFSIDDNDLWLDTSSY